MRLRIEPKATVKRKPAPGIDPGAFSYVTPLPACRVATHGESTPPLSVFTVSWIYKAFVSLVRLHSDSYRFVDLQGVCFPGWASFLFLLFSGFTRRLFLRSSFIPIPTGSWICKAFVSLVELHSDSYCFVDLRGVCFSGRASFLFPTQSFCSSLYFRTAICI